MKPSNALLIACAALCFSLAAATPASARDHHRHGSHGHHYYHSYRSYPRYYSGYSYNRPHYYRGPRVIYSDPYYYDGYYPSYNGPYYSRPYNSLTFSFGGSHWHHR